MSAPFPSTALPKRGTLAYLEQHPNTVQTMTFDEYWEAELKNEYKSEYTNNKVTAIMPYTTENHNNIVTNVILSLTPFVRSKGGQLYHESRPVWIQKCFRNVYPDIFIVAQSQKLVFKGQQVAETTPSVIIEILSSSTEEYDKGEKLRCYKSIPNLQQIVFIAQREVAVEILQKNKNDEWVHLDIAELEKSVSIFDCDIQLSKLYENVNFVDETEK